MRRIPFIVFSFVFLTGIFILLGNITRTKETYLNPSLKNVISQSTPGPTKVEVSDVPKKLKVPSIGIEAEVEQVGMDTQGRMDIPKNVDNVAWYNLGVKPGEVGSAVIDGHLDKVSGAPAVFWDIGKLKEGDEIMIVDAKKKEYKFKVSDVKTYAFDEVPLQQVFNTSDKPRLNLITCGGVWDQASKNYSNRTVVFSEMQ